MEITSRQMEIIEAAGEILTESGFGGLTTKKLAAKMGFGESALYRHFASKEAILLTMLHYLAHNTDQRFRSVLQGKEDPVEKLMALFDSQRSFFYTHPHFLAAIFSEGLLSESKKVEKAFLVLMRVGTRYLFPILRQGQAQGVFHPDLTAETIGQIIIGSLRLHMLIWRVSGFSPRIKEQGDQLTAGLLRLLEVNAKISSINHE